MRATAAEIRERERIAVICERIVLAIAILAAIMAARGVLA